MLPLERKLRRLEWLETRWHSLQDKNRCKLFEKRLITIIKFKMALKEIEELESHCLFDSFSDKFDIKEVDKLDEKQFPSIVRINLLNAFERAFKKESLEKNINTQSKDHVHQSAYSIDDKENKHPNLIQKRSEEKGSKLTPRSFLRKNESLFRPFCEKENSIFRKQDNPLINCHINRKVPALKQSDRSDSRFDQPKVMMLSKLIREASHRVNSSINCKKDEVYSVLYGNRTTKASQITRTNSNLLEGFNKGPEVTRVPEQKPPRPVSRNKYKLQNLFSLRSNDSGNQSRIESTISFLKRNERSVISQRYQSQQDLFKAKHSGSKDQSLNQIKQRCLNALSQLKADSSLDYHGTGNIMDSSNLSSQGMLRASKLHKDGESAKANVSFSKVLQMQARQTRLADHHNVYRHFKQLLDSKDKPLIHQPIR
jgi:hypothetical protein